MKSGLHIMEIDCLMRSKFPSLCRRCTFCVPFVYRPEYRPEYCFGGGRSLLFQGQ